MKAYDYVLDRLGQDSAAGLLWLEYIKFMSDFSPSSSAFRRLFEPEPGKEASKRALKLRDLYQKAMLVCFSLTWCRLHRSSAQCGDQNLNEHNSGA